MQSFLIILLPALAISAFAFSQESKKEYEVYEAQNFECLDYRGFERSGAGGVLHFKNLCGEKVYANVCIEYSDGSAELKENRRIPENGRWRISVFNQIPRNVHWASGRYNPVLPGPCGKI